MDVKRPIITEKSLGLASHGWYTFAVGKHTRKEKVAREVEARYHVNVLTVRTVAMHGKVRRTGKKMTTLRRADWKKAIVQLKAGQHIDAFEVTTKEESAKPADASTSDKASADKKAMAGKETEEGKLETQQKGKVKK